MNGTIQPSRGRGRRTAHAKPKKGRGRGRSGGGGRPSAGDGVRRGRPTHFLALRIDDGAAHAHLTSLQQRFAALNAEAAAACNNAKAAKFHVTLGLLYLADQSLSGEQEGGPRHLVGQALAVAPHLWAQAMQEHAPEHQGEARVPLGSLGHFGRGQGVRVVWIGLQEDDTLTRVLAAFVTALHHHLVQTLPTQWIDPSWTFAPHITLLKARGRGGSGVTLSQLEQHQKYHEPGQHSQGVQCIQWLAMGAPAAEDGYYHAELDVNLLED